MREMKESGVEWIGKIPNSWASDKVKYHFSNTKRIVGTKVNEYQRLALTLKGVIKRSKDDNEGLQPSEFRGYQILKNGELVFKLIDLQNTATSRVGLSSYTGIVSPAYIVLNGKDSIVPSFAEKYFLSMWHRNIFNHLGDSGVRSNLNAQELLNVSIAYPNITEQYKIADFLDQKCSEIDALTTDIQTQIETLEEYKKSVITEAVTKGLDPNVEMKDSGVEWIGKIPANWTVIKIKYLSNEVNQKKLMNTESMYSYLGLENLKSYSDEIIKTETDYDEGIQKFCHKGNVLFSKLRPYLAKVMICPYDTFATSEFLELSPSECVCDANYLKYSMLNSSFINEVNLSTYGAKMPRADASYIKNIKICITNLDEQHRIADFLDQKCSEIDQTISEKQQQLETLAEYKKSLIYEYVTGKKEVA